MTSQSAVIDQAQPVEPLNDHVIAALDLMRQWALETYPQEAARIQRGYAIALLGGVHLQGDGLAAIQSQSQPETWYTVNGHCRCYDSTRVRPGHCKHRWAKTLLTKALTYLAQHSIEPLDTLPAPYAFPRWRYYEATYQGPESGWEHVNGIAELIESGLFFFRPAGQATGWHCGYAEVALGPGIEAAQESAPGVPVRLEYAHMSEYC